MIVIDEDVSAKPRTSYNLHARRRWTTLQRWRNAIREQATKTSLLTQNEPGLDAHLSEVSLRAMALEFGAGLPMLAMGVCLPLVYAVDSWSADEPKQLRNASNGNNSILRDDDSAYDDDASDE